MHARSAWHTAGRGAPGPSSPLHWRLQSRHGHAAGAAYSAVSSVCALETQPFKTARAPQFDNAGHMHPASNHPSAKCSSGAQQRLPNPHPPALRRCPPRPGRSPGRTPEQGMPMGAMMCYVSHLSMCATGSYNGGAGAPIQGAVCTLATATGAHGRPRLCHAAVAVNSQQQGMQPVERHGGSPVLWYSANPKRTLRPATSCGRCSSMCASATAEGHTRVQ